MDDKRKESNCHVQMHYLSRTYIKEKWNHSGFQKYFRNTGWMFVGKIISLLISFVATAYIARHLGPTNYGQLSYALSYVGLFAFISTLGIDQTLYRDVIRFPEKKNAYMGTAIGLRLAASVVTIVLCISTALFLSDTDVSLFLISIVSLTFAFTPFQLLSYEFQSEMRSKYPSLISLIVTLILNTLKIAAIMMNQGVIYLAAIVLAEPILYAIGFIYFRKKYYGRLNLLTFDRALAPIILKDSLPLVFASAFFAIYARIDQVMIKNMIDTESVGLYDAAVRISELWYFIPTMIVASFFPAIINAKKTSQELYYKRMAKLSIAVVSISLLTAFLTVAGSKYFILAIFGPNFLGGLTVLNIYVWSNIGAALNHLSQQFLITENLSHRISVNIFLGAVANVGLNLILIPQYGIAGAAIATLISYAVPFLSLLLFKDSRILLYNVIHHAF